jgi:hypothetical protein
VADTKISALSAVGSVADAQEFAVNDAGVSKKATALQLKTYVDQNARNWSTSTPAAGFAADTYLAGSNVLLSAAKLRIATQYRLLFSVAKTAAGVAAPVITIRMGTSGVGAIGDASVLAITMPIQTAAVDEGVFTLEAGFRSVGSGTSAVMSGVCWLVHEGIANASTGLANQANPVVTAVGSGFDSTTRVVIGASLNAGSLAAWTIVVVQAALTNMI